MKNLKKAFCLILVASMMTSLVACGGKNAKDNKAGQGADVENMLASAKENSTSYVFKLDNGFDMSGIEGKVTEFRPTDNAIYISTNSSPVDTSDIASAGDVVPDEVAPDNICRIYKLAMEDNKAEVVYETAPENKGKEKIKNLIPGFDGTLSFVRSNGDDNFTLCKVTDGKAEELGDAKLLGEDMVPGKILSDKDGNYYGIDYSNIKVVDSTCKAVTTITDGDIENAGVDKNGDIVVVTTKYIESDESTEVSISKIDLKSGKLTDSRVIPVSSIRYDSDVTKGTNGYDVFFSTSSSMYGYTFEDDKTEKICGYSSSNINSNLIGHVTPVDDKTFVMNEIDPESYETKDGLYKYIKVDPSEIEEKNVLTLVTLYGNDGLKTAAIDYNNSQDENKIEIIDYSDASDPNGKFSADIVAGAKPDMYDMSYGLGDLSMDLCINKGMLEDIAPYLEKDKDIKADDLIPSALNAMKTGDKMYFVSPNASLTTLIGKKSIVGDSTGWTATEMYDVLKSQPKDIKVFESSNKKDNLLSFLSCCVNDYIDWEKGECSFDSEDFKFILEMCNRGSNEEMQWGEEEYKEIAFKNNSLLCAEATFDFYESHYFNQLLGDELSVKGYPNKDKNTCSFIFSNIVAMSAQSENKEVAWDFMKYLLSEDFQGKLYKNISFFGFPTRKDVFEASVEKNTATKPYTDKYGNDIKPIDKDEIDMGGFVFKRGPLSQDEVDLVNKLIESAKGMKKDDRKVKEIINEEAQAYFAGDKSVDDVCKVIQDRVTTYINETK